MSYRNRSDVGDPLILNERDLYRVGTSTRGAMPRELVTFPDAQLRIHLGKEIVFPFPHWQPPRGVW
ncbi:hypothetical protein FRACA_320034 [Frankia canadensis]|uniref:Uncharacterized protein n=1 Tax=Frankia canadensis TaxID=1836972 RepID=A0A2I2KUJ1_9ACTN|nr:hypothetical protein FRACA_320034 [Frankia canadensis]SOU56626.1 hypothetical protein FRACA_320034 [Frankia canadensis]